MKRTHNLCRKVWISCPRISKRSLSSSSSLTSRRSFSSTSTAEEQDVGKASGFGSGTHAKFAHVPETSKKPHESLATCAFRVADRPGALEEALKVFWKYDVNMTHIESRPAQGSGFDYSFVVDFERPDTEDVHQKLIDELGKTALDVTHLDPRVVPWFPRKQSDLDLCIKTLDAGADLESDHPGFNDQEYRKRRQMICDLNASYKTGTEIPRWEYTADETATWGAVYRKLQSLFPKYACKQYNYILPLLEKNCGYAPDNIPQLEDISQFLRECTGFQLRPVSGLLSARDFLNGLAFRTFFSTQYIRHHSMPLYTPEPDICHELMGHAPMFADPDFAEFSHNVGLASLGASDDDIQRLATCYWFSVEFGICRENGEKKAYGAGLLSSFGELEYSCSPDRPAGGTDDMPEYREWDPSAAARQEYPITTYQPIYYVSDSLESAKDRMLEFCDSIHRPFSVRYHPYSNHITVDRAVLKLEKEASE